MLIRLISLAILLLLIDTNHISLADENFILPKDKPSVFKKIEKSKTEIRSVKVFLCFNGTDIFGYILFLSLIHI